MEVCSKTTCLGATAGDCFCRLQFGAAKGDADFQHELFPLHSPLLRESWLVSFPPLSNMLKSSGSSYLIGGPKGMPSRAQAGGKAVSFDAAYERRPAAAIVFWLQKLPRRGDRPPSSLSLGRRSNRMLRRPTVRSSSSPPRAERRGDS